MPDLDADTDEARSRGTSSRAREAMAIVDVCVFTQNGECQDANTPQMSISDTKCDLKCVWVRFSKRYHTLD